MKIREIHRETWIDQEKEVIFNFFRNMNNLIEVTTSSIPITVLSDNTNEMDLGTVIDLKIKLFKFIPIKWQTKISEWSPPDYFVDTQPKGPYRYWKHTHQFVEQEGGTLVIDHVEYAVPGFFFEPLINALIVRKNLENLFDYRQIRYIELLSR